MIDSADSLGPLPIADRQDTLQQLSLTALRRRLPTDMFLFRDERVDDKGVDFALETKIEFSVAKENGEKDIKRQFTNCRAQAQLKSTDSTEHNKDGSISLSIETSNLNYLLNGSSPLYFLWIAPTDEVRFAWAKDEWSRLDAANPEWKKQGTFTVRFREILDANAITSIHDRIMKEAQFARRINEILARSALSETVVVTIDPKTLQSTDPQQLYQWLTSSGKTIVSSGYGSEVLDWIGALNPNHRREARIQLVAAFAHVTLGRNHEAAGNLSLAAVSAADLTPEDREFMAYLSDVCAYQTGRIDRAEYLRRVEERERSKTGVAAAEHRLEILRNQRLYSRDRGQRAEFLKQMHATATQIDTATDAKPAHKLNARIHLMSADGDDLTGRFSQEFSQIQTRRKMGVPAEEVAQQANVAMSKLWEEWDKGARKCIEDAVNEGHPLLVAEAMTSKTVVYQVLVLTQRMLAATTETIWTPPESVLRAAIDEVERAIEIYWLAGNMEGETRAKLLLADLLESLGENQAAKKIAEEALVVARAMGYSQHESHAQEHITGKTIFRDFQQTLAARNAIDEDVHTADESDERVLAIATHTLKSLKLPVDRLPVIQRDAESCRLIARERINYCRHINLIQNLEHTLHFDTHYRTDPERSCVCEKHGYRSSIEHTDADLIIGAFKRAYCDECPDRAPKGRGKA